MEYDFYLSMDCLFPLPHDTQGLSLSEIVKFNSQNFNRWKDAFNKYCKANNIKFSQEAIIAGYKCALYVMQKARQNKLAFFKEFPIGIYVDAMREFESLQEFKEWAESIGMTDGLVSSDDIDKVLALARNDVAYISAVEYVAHAGLDLNPTIVVIENRFL